MLVLATLVLSGMFTTVARGQELQVRSYTAGDGLPGHEVEDIAQLPSGRMAFLTRRGLSLYDGATWVNRQLHEASGSTPWHLCSGEGEVLWAFIGSRIHRYVDGTHIESIEAPLKSSQASYFTSLVQPEGHSLLTIVGTGGRICVHDGASWLVDTIDPPPGGISAVTTFDDRLLVGSADGVLKVDPRTRESIPCDLGPPSKNFIALEYDARADVLWGIGRESWLVKFEQFRSATGDAVRSYQIPEQAELITGLGPDQDPVDSRWATVWDFPLTADLAGGLYYGSRFCLNYFHPLTGFERLGEWNGLNTNAVTSAIRDHEGNTWLCGSRGANKIISQRIRSYRREDGLLDDEVSAAIELSDGSILLGHGGGLTRFSKNKDVPHQKIFLSSNRVQVRVMDLAEDEGGQIWFAAGTFGLGTLHPDGRVDSIQLDAPESIISLAIEESGGTFWVASDRALYSYLDGNFEPFPLPGDLGHVQIRKLYLDDDGVLYAATGADGVLQITDSGVRQWADPSPRSPTNSVYSILFDSKQNRWAATKNGLARLEDDGALVLEDRFELRRPTYSLVEDHDRRLWIGSDIGAHCWDGIALETLTPADGLAGEEANRSGAIVSREGVVWIGSDDGLTSVDDRLLPGEAAGPRIELGTVMAGEEELDLNRAHRFGHENRSLTFSFRVYSFVDEDRVLVQSFLEGWDEEWSPPEPNKARQIRYMNLPPGKYRCKLRAVDVLGRTSPVVASQWFHVDKHRLDSNWFRVGMVLVALILLTGGFLFALQRRYARRLKEEVARQTEELLDLEREQEKLLRLESLGVLAGGIAHDFNNLLTTIMGNASLLEDEASLPKWMQESIEDIGFATSKAEALAARLLTFSKGGSPVLETTEVGDIIEECVRFGLLGSSVQPEILIPNSLYPVDLDTGQFSQVMNNLVINARQAMKSGGTLLVRARNDSSAGGSPLVVIEVTDQGPGIDPTDMDHIFDPYFTTKADGHGLGLATAHSIIERHGGVLSAHSVLGSGATFRISLPASTASVIIPAPGAGQVSSDRSSIGARVLVMDDQAALRRIARTILERSGCSVLEAGDGQVAYDLYREALYTEQPVDVVLMDLTVPGGMGGIEATALIRELDPSAAVIATSGYAEGDEAARYRDFGFRLFLRKPFKANELCGAVLEARDPSAMT